MTESLPIGLDEEAELQRRTAGRARAIVLLMFTMIMLSSCRTDWSTWGYGSERQGYNPWEQTITPSTVAGLHHQWSVDLGAFINASPIVATGINVGGTTTDVVYVGTEHGVLFAVSTAGRILWFQNLGQHTSNCPNTPDEIFGVSASAVFDRSTNRVYAAGGDGNVYALNPSTGAILPGWPVRVTSDPAHEFVYSAPNLFRGNLYVGLSSRCDITPYHGRVVRIDTTTGATNAFYVTGSANGPDGGGVWGWGGVSVDPTDGNVYVATGNTIANPENSFYGDHVVRLDASLNVVAANSPGVGIEDDDFGSTPILFQKSGCPPQLVTEQKNGSLYLYDRNSIAGGYRQKVTLMTGAELIGVPAYSPATQMVYVVNLAPHGFFVQGLLAFRLDSSCQLQLAWQSASPVTVSSTPTLAGGVVYYSDGLANTIHALDASTGTPLWASGAELSQPLFAAPIVANGQLFAGAYDDKLHAWGLS